MTSTVTCICGCELLGARPAATCRRRACARALRANELARARDPDASPADLAALAHSRSLLVRAAAARHPATPPASLASLARDDVRVAREVAANPGVDEPTLRALWRRRRTTVSRALAANPALPEDAYVRLGARHPRELARNPAWREHAAERPDHAAYRPGSELVWRLLMARAAPPAMLARVVAAGTARERGLLASQPGAALEALVTAGTRDEALRRVVARNPACPEALLRALALVGDERVRVTAAFNPAAPPDLVEEVFAGWRRHVLRWWPRQALRHPGVLQALARDPSTPSAVRDELLVLGDRTVRRLLADNPATAGRVLRVIAGALDLTDPLRLEVGLILSVAAHPRAPADVLRRLAEVAVGAVRAAVARHPATPRDVLEGFARQRDWSTRDAGPVARARLTRQDERAASTRPPRPAA